MTDYSQGKIYMLTSEQTQEVYIGSTKETLERRLIYHKAEYKRWLEGKNNYMTSFEILQYDDCEIHLIEDYPCESRKELDLKEGEYQRMIDCINKNIAGRSKKEWRKDNKEHIKQKNKEYYSNPIVKERKKEYMKEHYQKNKEKIKNRPKIKCVCGSEYRKADTKRHQRTQKHIKYIEEMKEKADATNLNEFFEQFKFKLVPK